MWPFKKKPKTVKFAGEKFVVKPLNLEQTLELMLVLAPHLAVIENYMPEIKRRLSETSGKRPELLRVLFISMRDDLRELPGDMTKALSILCSIDNPAWVAKNATPEEFLEALPVLDEVHDFARLWGAIQALGVSVGYR